MAKVKIKKESVLKLRFTEHSGQEWELWEEFYLDLVKALAHKGFYLDLSFRTQGLLWIHQGIAKEALNKEIIKELAQKHNIEIEFEEEKEKKKEKWRPVHEVAIERLKKWPVPELSTMAGIYKDGAKVPSKNIPALIDALSHAVNKPGVDLWTEKITKEAIKNLKQQQKEG